MERCAQYGQRTCQRLRCDSNRYQYERFSAQQMPCARGSSKCWVERSSKVQPVSEGSCKVAGTKWLKWLYATNTYEHNNTLNEQRSKSVDI